MANDRLGSLFVNRGALPENTEASRAGGGWQVQTTTLFAPLVAVPTTAAILEIWNNVANDNVLVVDTLFADQVLATAAVQTYAIYACVSTPKAVPALTALTVHSVSGRGAYATTLGTRVVTGVGTTVVANGWRPWGTVQAWGLAAATPGNAWHVNINGKLLVPPGCSLLLHVVGSLATAASFQMGASWYETNAITAVS